MTIHGKEIEMHFIGNEQAICSGKVTLLFSSAIRMKEKVAYEDFAHSSRAIPGLMEGNYFCVLNLAGMICYPSV